MKKKCFKCKTEQPLENFSTYKGKHKAECKECAKIRMRLWVEKNRQKVNEYQLSYYHKRQKEKNNV